jgi:hypothetical protein
MFDLRDANNRAIIGGVLLIAWTLFTYFFPKPKKGTVARVWASMQGALQRVGGIRAFVWVIGICLFSLIGYGILLRTQTILRVCTGQFEGGCPPHDMFLGCYGLPKAEQLCWHYKNLGQESDVGGNMCGYQITRVRCGSGFF